MEKIAVSDKGYKRENNQDYHFMDPQNRYFIIADGMGGHNAGEIASYTAVIAAQGLLKDFVAESIDQVESKLIEVFDIVNDAVYNKSLETKTLSGMGTTMVLSYLYKRHLIVAHVGDSRAYLFNDGNLSRLTKDHSLVQEMIERGEIDPIDAQNHPKRHLITRAVGTQSSILPDISNMELPPGTVSELFMCTDGLTDYVNDEELECICSHLGTLGERASEMLSLALDRGGFDNISITAIRISEPLGSC